MTKELIVTKSIKINVDTPRVWEAITHSEWTRKFMFNCDVVSDWKPGSTIEFISTLPDKDIVQVKGNILKIEPGKLLQYTVFGPNAGLKDIPSNYTTVTYKLTPDNEQTLVSVTQGDFSTIKDGETRFGHSLKGWELALGKLKEELEK
jgi:uncharacterized protein YndB with AHSA1/START domain